MTSAWRSDPPSIGMSGPNGYGPGSLSVAYVKPTDTFACPAPTSAYGIPYEGGPKSGCRKVDPACVACFHVADFAFTGSDDTFMCHTLLRGNTGHVVPGTEPAVAGPGTTSSEASTLTIPTHTVRPPCIVLSSSARVTATVEGHVRRSPERAPHHPGPHRASGRAGGGPRPDPRARRPRSRTAPRDRRPGPARRADRDVAGHPLSELPRRHDALGDVDGSRDRGCRGNRDRRPDRLPRLPRRHRNRGRPRVGMGTTTGDHLPRARAPASVVHLPPLRSGLGGPRDLGDRLDQAPGGGAGRSRAGPRGDGEALAAGARSHPVDAPDLASRPDRVRDRHARARGVVVPRGRPEGAIRGSDLRRRARLARRGHRRLRAVDRRSRDTGVRSRCTADRLRRP